MNPRTLPQSFWTPARGKYRLVLNGIELTRGTKQEVLNRFNTAPPTPFKPHSIVTAKWEGTDLICWRRDKNGETY